MRPATRLFHAKQARHRRQYRAAMDRVHIADATAQAIKTKGLRNPGLMATAFTMEPATGRDMGKNTLRRAGLNPAFGIFMSRKSRKAQRRRKWRRRIAEIVVGPRRRPIPSGRCAPCSAPSVSLETFLSADPTFPIGRHKDQLSRPVVGACRSKRREPSQAAASVA